MLYQDLQKENIISKPKSFEWFCNELHNRGVESVTIIGDYTNMSTGVLVKCNDCGYEWTAKPQHLLRGHTCRKCALLRRDCKHNKRKTTDEFINELKTINTNIEILGQYINAKTHIDCRCTVCGHLWSAKPINLLSGCGCPMCGNSSARDKQLATQDDFISRMKVVNKYIHILGEYEGNKVPIRCMCAKCGNTWSAIPSNLLRGTGCPRHNSSHGETCIRNWLTINKIAFEEQKKFPNLLGIGGRLLPYDFYISGQNVLIEYQGSFHDRTDRLQTDADYEVRLKHDNIKREYAKTNGITLVEIWYYDKIEEKLREFFGITNPVTTKVT